MTWQMVSARRRRRLALTLLELLVVIVIIGILAALLLPAIQASRASAHRVQCANNLKQMGLSSQLHHDALGVFPASWVNGRISVTWGRSLLPYLELENVFDSWDPDLGFLEGPNGELAATRIPIYKCPAAPSLPVYEYETSGYPLHYATTDYKGCQGTNPADPAVKHWQLAGWLDGVVSRKPLPRKMITDGLSNTILLVESVGGLDLHGPAGGPWTPSEIWYMTDGSWTGRALSSVSPVLHAQRRGLSACSVNCTNMYDYGPYSFHPGGAQAVLCDGAVVFLDEAIDGAVLAGYYAYNEGQLILDK